MKHIRVTTQPTGDVNLDKATRERQQVEDINERPGGPRLGAGGRMVLELEFASGGEMKVAHGLRRKPSGWVIARSYGAGAALLVETASDSNSITLAHGAATGVACKVDLWVF